MGISNELQIGKAGEYLVCADLILKGYVAYISEQGLPYDVILDTGSRLLKVQVKTTQGPRVIPQRAKVTHAYIFSIKRNGKNNVKRYGESDVDIFALVCLDTRQVGYVIPKDMPDTLNIRKDSLKGTYYDEKGIQDLVKVKELSLTMNQTQVAKSLGLHVAQVNRMLKEGYCPYETKARYFSHFEREPEWFTNL